jgi:hypothetical protein
MMDPASLLQAMDGAGAVVSAAGYTPHVTVTTTTST